MEQARAEDDVGSERMQAFGVVSRVFRPVVSRSRTICLTAPLVSDHQRQLVAPPPSPP